MLLRDPFEVRPTACAQAGYTVVRAISKRAEPCRTTRRTGQGRFARKTRPNREEAPRTSGLPHARDVHDLHPGTSYAADVDWKGLLILG